MRPNYKTIRLPIVNGNDSLIVSNYHQINQYWENPVKLKNYRIKNHDVGVWKIKNWKS